MVGPELMEARGEGGKRRAGAWRTTSSPWKGRRDTMRPWWRGRVQGANTDGEDMRAG